ncbi:MAG: VTT domain-containing protein [Alkalispirochaeta sp.]
MHKIDLREGTHYRDRTHATQLSLLTSSAEYFAAVQYGIHHAARRILIVGWSIDDRIRLVRDAPDQSLGELLVNRARENRNLHIQIRIWEAPAVFGADQHITTWFETQCAELENLDLVRVPAASAFAARHEKYIIIDDRVAWLGGIDLSHNRWDMADHRVDNPHRANPDGERYVPYHDTHLMFSGPAVRALFRVAVLDGLIQDDWKPAAATPWPPDRFVDLHDQELFLSCTRSYPDGSHEDERQILHLYRDLVHAAEERIFIENQYFSSNEITEAVMSRLQEPQGPEVIVIMSRELPDTLGRMTMGVNSTLHLARLIEHDRYRRLGIFYPVSADDGATNVKVHSKTMVVDGKLFTLGSANISRRSFSLDSELNATVQGGESSGETAGSVLEDRLLAQHTGLSVEAWRVEVQRCGGSRLAAIHERISQWDGLIDGRDHVIADAPRHVPQEILDRFDMDQPPPQETVFQRTIRSNPWEIITRTKRVWASVLGAIAVIGLLFYAAQIDFDIQEILQRIADINSRYPIVGVLLTIASFWLTMLVFVTIVVPIVFFSALHGPVLGMVYSTVGIFSGAFIFYAIGRALHTASWPDRYHAVRLAKEQLARIKPYGLWAVAISRMVPSGPFLVVNLVTGLLGFSPVQFFAGSAVGLLPGIVAFSVFGEVVRNVFTDPSIMSTIWFVVFVVAYSGAVRALLLMVQRIASWTSGERRE